MVPSQFRGHGTRPGNIFTSYNARMIMPASLRDQLSQSVQRVWQLYCALESMVPHTTTGGINPAGPSRQRPVSPTIPWHHAAATLTLDIHQGIRKIERHWKSDITGILGGQRGGSHRNTQHALTSVSKLAEAIDDQNVLAVLQTVNRWISRAQTIFDPDHGLHQLPRQPGEDIWCCPWCQSQTLRWNPPTGIIVCIRPTCTDDNDHRPRWRALHTLDDDDGALTFTWEPITQESA